jgi:hypothetical protein
MEFLDREVTEGFHREDFFLAQIAAEVRRSYVKNPSKVSAKEFLLEFSTKKPTPLNSEKRSKEAKYFFMRSLGLEKPAK